MSTPNSIMATIPASFPFGVYSVRVRCGSDTSNSLTVNAPRVWWFGGNCGNTSTANGTLRLFGTGLSLQHDEHLSPEKDSLEVEAKTALEARDFDRLETLAKELASMLNRASSVSPKLLLTLIATTPSGVPAIELEADPTGLTEYHARFTLPTTIAPGEYTVSVANELASAWTAIAFFESPIRPHVSSIVITEPELPLPSEENDIGGRSFQVDTVCARVPPGVFVVWISAAACRQPCRDSRQLTALPRLLLR
eukprot:m.26705 g.26705  ORF g.26705 m.26705 type:complete len:252 (+) comp11832_c0_seq2:234-989(+)